MAANQELVDATLRHAIALRRYTTGEVKSMLAVLSASEQELAKKLKKLDPAKWGTARQKELLVDIRAARVAAVRELAARSKKELVKLAAQEQRFQLDLLSKTVPVVLDYARVDAKVLRALVTEQPFAGGTNAARTLAQWWRGVEAADQRRILEAIQMGVVQGEGIPSIMSRVMRAADLTRVNAEAVARTAVNHVSNSAREAVAEANSDIVKYSRWTATLDGRTTLICAGRDGKYAPVGDTPMSEVPMPHLDPPGASPPAHPNCRSVMVPVLDPSGLAVKAGERPTVVDTRTRRERERDFRAEARARAGDNWGEMTSSERRAATTDARDAWARRAVGTVSAEETYDEWLRRQSKEFQDEVLGPGRGTLFRSGMLVDQFTDGSGKTLTLEQLGVESPRMGGLAAEARPALDFSEVDLKNVDQRLETIAKHDELHGRWREQSGLQEEHLEALRRYQQTEFSGINKSLRADTVEGITKDRVEWIDDAFDRTAPLEQDLYVYRRGNLSPSSAETLFGGAVPREGAAIQDLGYTSTSLSKVMWEEFRTGFEPDNSVYNFRIRVPEGSRVIPMFHFGNESEMLLPHGSKFRVVGVRSAGTTDIAKGIGRRIFEIELEMLP